MEIIRKIKEKFITKINENNNYKIDSLPAINDDIFIYCYYGLIDIYQDEIKEINSLLFNKNNLYYQSDIIIKCLGYKFDDSLLKNHQSNNTIFIDNSYNINHNCGLDRAGKDNLMVGPDSQS